MVIRQGRYAPFWNPSLRSLLSARKYAHVNDRKVHFQRRCLIGRMDRSLGPAWTNVVQFNAWYNIVSGERKGDPDEKSRPQTPQRSPGTSDHWLGPRGERRKGHSLNFKYHVYPDTSNLRRFYFNFPRSGPFQSVLQLPSVPIGKTANPPHRNGINI